MIAVLKGLNVITFIAMIHAWYKMVIIIIVVWLKWVGSVGLVGSVRLG